MCTNRTQNRSFKLGNKNCFFFFFFLSCEVNVFLYKNPNSYAMRIEIKFLSHLIESGRDSLVLKGTGCIVACQDVPSPEEFRSRPEGIRKVGVRRSSTDQLFFSRPRVARVSAPRRRRFSALSHPRPIFRRWNSTPMNVAGVKKIRACAFSMFSKLVHVKKFTYRRSRYPAYYRALKARRESLPKTGATRRKLSSIGNYLNRLYDYRKLPSLLKGFRCITVLVAALRKGSCKCKSPDIYSTQRYRSCLPISFQSCLQNKTSGNDERESFFSDKMSLYPGGIAGAKFSKWSVFAFLRSVYEEKKKEKKETASILGAF
ncbi:hypothetical protein PUN28_007394 [Cardiocondyla obscurior]|uniref:Uncharacterized protein n=1 Tax=Cardiocondyla obscurior TaxID=286306 RepID=A0AAW2G993_9HYME